MNPFDSASSACYSDFVKNQIKKLSVGEAVMADLGQKDVVSFRASLAYASSQLGRSCKTKTDRNGNLWIKRVA